ncbi:Hsp70 family protein [Phytohabitans houttuyneae]|uniref:Hsp70 family protein n=1 Tax=Phytohabitans houttuyneae TaxID=1076126 RepID=A0A6V8KIE8_9ACTN|nr:Hsp70 family protein [Phytohabitans houttuyneae]GFJ84982.1 hypothetical protein Phou_091620 [Phytohabitans houttuyneae]
MRYGELRLTVDCGSVTTVAVLAWDDGWLPLQWGGWPWLSSAVHVSADGRITAGEGAWLAAQSTPDGLVPGPVHGGGEDRLLVSGVQISSAELVAAILRLVVDEANRVAGGPVRDVRLVVPAGWGPRRSTRLRHAARLAGLEDVTLVPAPVAVGQHLLASEVRLPVGSYLAVCDLGGGVEASVLRRGPTGFEILSTLADEHGGGSRIDELLVAHLDGHRPDPQALGGGRWPVVAAVRAAKEAASIHPTVTVGSPPVVWTAGQVQAVARPVLERAARLVVEAVAAADLAPDRLAGVFMVGGGASMPLAGRVIGEAALLMVVACLSAATMIASVLPMPTHPRTPAGSDASQLAGGLLVAAGLGAAVAGVYAVGPSLIFGAPVEPFLRWTLLPIVPLVATVVAVAALVARWGRRPAQGWHSWLGFPVIATIPVAVGMLLVDHVNAYYGDHMLPNLVERFGGLLVGVGIAWTMVRPWLWRLVLAGPVGAVTAALTDYRTIGVLAAAYIAAVTLWWLQRVWQLWQRPPQRWLPGT